MKAVGAFDAKRPVRAKHKRLVDTDGRGELDVADHLDYIAALRLVDRALQCQVQLLCAPVRGDGLAGGHQKKRHGRDKVPRFRERRRKEKRAEL